MKTEDRWKQRDCGHSVAESLAATPNSSVLRESQDGIQVHLRTPEPDDVALGLVLDSWTKAVADHSPWATQLKRDSSANWQGRLGSGETRQGGTTAPIPRPILLHHHDILLKRLIPHSDIVLACDPSDSDTVWGWSCSDLMCLHFIYVKNAFRGFGIGRLLLEDTGLRIEEKIRISHRTPALFSHWPGVHFLWNPYRMMIWN
jgi:GNAT superfamily N-acetyltransferase